MVAKKKPLKKKLLVYDKSEKAQDLLSDYNFYRKEIELLKEDVSNEGKTVLTNEGKTLMQNPKIKILTDFTKNMHATLNQLQKLIEVEEDELDELSEFLQKRNKE